MGFLSAKQFTELQAGTPIPGFRLWQAHIPPSVAMTEDMYAEVPTLHRPITTALPMATRYIESGPPTLFAETNREMIPFSGRKF